MGTGHCDIAVSKTCSTKDLSPFLTECLILVQNQQQRYCKAIYNYSGINRFWIIDNYSPVLQLVNKCNSKTVSDIKTYGFSTLYTSIPHTKLKEAIEWAVKKAFYGSGKKYITVRGLRIFWSDKELSEKQKEKDTAVQITEK